MDQDFIVTGLLSELKAENIRKDAVIRGLIKVICGVVAAVLVAVVQDGEPVAGSTMLYTPAAVAVPGNISTDVLVRVYQCCSTSMISVRNTGADTIDIQDANIVVTRES